MKVRKVPAKYTTGISKSTADKRKAEIRKRQAGKVKGKDLYKPLPGDSKKTTTKSIYTRKVGKLRTDILARAQKMQGNQAERFIKAVAAETGIPKRIIEQVYNKGLKAHATSGHRVGATASQWAIARVYSFLTGGKTSKTADAALYLEAKEAIKGKPFKLP
jgi:hypothetical protein